MQTFLPYENFALTAKSLDMKRLGKQRVETLQVIKALSDVNYGWRSHPAVKMWQGYGPVLLAYQQAVCDEWTSRGYRDTCLEKSRIAAEPLMRIDKFCTPDWLGNEALHLSHRSNLIRKFPEFYRPIFGDDVPDDLEYVWPV